MQFGSSRSWKALLVATLAVAAIGFGGCGKGEVFSELRPEGDPEILQVFAIDSDGVSKMAAGEHPEIKDDPNDDIAPIHADRNGPVDNAIVFGNRIRVVLDELLNPATAEQFRCACWGNGCATRGHTFNNTEVDVNRCTSCEDDTTTPDINETGKCLDVNFDGVPDDAFLQAGILSLDCGVATVDITEDEGWYNPSGNQQIPVALGTDALGPALVIAPAALPTNADCTVVIAASVTDKDGNSVPTPPFTPGFHTEPLVVAATSPSDGAMGIALDSTVNVQFNAEIDPAVPAAAITVETGGVDTPGATSVDPADPTLLVWTPTALLLPQTTYTVHVTTMVTDTFGSALPAEETFTFTTGAM